MKFVSDGFIISPVGDGEPKEGLFCVRFGKNTPDRALSVIKHDGIWQVFLDGARVADPSTSWEDAFGWIWKKQDGDVIPFLMGRTLDAKEYEKIIRLRLTDARNGVDVSRPIDLSTVPTPF